MAKAGRSIVVFDLGGVLIDWDPRHLYRKLFAGDESAMEQLFATVCTHEWNRCQDGCSAFKRRGPSAKLRPQVRIRLPAGGKWIRTAGPPGVSRQLAARKV